jgi:hypothetical protein
MGSRSLSCVLLALAPLLASGCAHYKLIDDEGEPNRAALARMERKVEDVRGLAFRHPVAADALDDEEVRAYFEARFSGPSPWLDRQTKVAHKLGILPGHIHLRDLYKTSYSTNAAALYERAGEGRMLLFPEAFPSLLRVPLGVINFVTATDWLNELVVSHELMHALQDQHFELEKVLPGRLYATNEDQALARKSVVESEANLVSYAYVFRMDLDSWAQRNLLSEYLLATSGMSLGLALLANRRSPSFYTRILTLQYFHGMRFLSQTANAGGDFSAVTRAYGGGLPESTEQLLWPEKFAPAAYDPPLQLVSLEDDSLEGWARIDENTFGELSLRTLLDLFNPRGDAVEAARGWGGDRYDVFERDDRVLLAWRLLFDSDDDATEFERAYKNALKGKYPGRASRRVPGLDDDGWQLWRMKEARNDKGQLIRPGVPTSKSELVALRREGTRVVLLEGLDPATWRRDADAVWSRAEAVTPERPPSSPLAQGEAVTAPRPQREDRGLERSLFLGHHEMEARMGIGARRVPAGWHDLRETHIRWGIRPHVEVSVPLALRLGGRRGPLFHSVSLGVPGPYGGGGTLALQVTGAAFAGSWGALVLQARTQMDPPGLSRTPWLSIGGAVSAALQPFAGVRLSGGALVEQSGTLPTSAPFRGLTLGSVARRGMLEVPLVELQILDGLHAYLASRVTLDPASGVVVEERHSGGLLLYF